MGCDYASHIFFHIILSSIPSKKINCHLSSVTNLYALFIIMPIMVLTD